MKPTMNGWLVMLGALASLGLAVGARGESPKLEVHEWGTFTVLSGSDGHPIEWYQPGGDLTSLPEFVQPTIFVLSKAAPRPAYLRMETPVVYFYTDQSIPVEVAVEFPQGRFTEWFPHPAGQQATRLSWKGTLLPPDDAAALARIPAVKELGRHYAHARNVPEAWIYRADPPTPARALNLRQPGKDAEKFLFYRGVGDFIPAYRVSLDGEHQFHLRRQGEGGAVVHAFAVSVQGNRASWARLPALPAASPEKPATFTEGVAARLPEPATPVNQVEVELAAAMTTALEASGLTPAEARAMVATWEGNWFREPGNRVLAILPRDAVDHVLPWKISPAPQKTERVYVARFETLTAHTEQSLLALLQGDVSPKPTTAQRDAFRGLELGRFSMGALKRVQQIESARMQQRFYALQAPEPAPAPETASAAAATKSP